jgi:PAS domain S-box-containing protein
VTAEGGAIAGFPDGAMLRALVQALESAGLGCTVVLAYPDRLERVYSNEAMARIYGVDREAMKTIEPFGRLSAAERARFEKLRWDVRAGAPQPPLVSTRIVRPDGTSVPVELGLGYALLGDVRAIVVFMRDTSARAAMEDALRESEARFRLLAEVSPDSIAVYAGGRCLYANPVALELMGLRSLDDLVGHDPLQQVDRLRLGEISEHVSRVKRGERVAPLVHRVPRPDGSDAFVEASLSVTTFGGESALVSWGRDVTERMRLQAELMKRDRLASVGVLAAGVAHELNNPLMTLSLQAKRLREDAVKNELPAHVRVALEHIDEAAQRMKAIVSDLLFMSRPSEQPQAHVDVGRILASAAALLRAGAPGCPPIALEVDAALPPIRGYPSKLGQVFLNVLRNAAQAVEGMERAEIRVSARPVAAGLEIVVSDTGAGIAEDVLPRVAEPFFTTKPDGTGLGLWISQSIVTQHGGTLEVSTSKGAGTTVTIVLPA